MYCNGTNVYDKFKDICDEYKCSYSNYLILPPNNANDIEPLEGKIKNTKLQHCQIY